MSKLSFDTREPYEFIDADFAGEIFNEADNDNVGEMIYGKIEPDGDGVSHTLIMWNDDATFEERRHIPAMYGKPHRAVEDYARDKFQEFGDDLSASRSEYLAEE